MTEAERIEFDKAHCFQRGCRARVRHQGISGMYACDKHYGYPRLEQSDAPTSISDGDYRSPDPMRRGIRTRLLPETEYAAAIAPPEARGRESVLAVVRKHRDENRAADVLSSYSDSFVIARALDRILRECGDEVTP